MKRSEWLAVSDMVIICEKMNVFEIAEMMQEDPDDVALALFHLSQEGKLRKAARRWR